MKQVMVIRHAPKDISGELTQDGILLAQKSRGLLENFNKVISSDMPRARQTATLLVNGAHVIDKRASIPDFSLQQERELFELGKLHPSGIAGVIFDTPLYRDLAEARGKTLVELIKETLQNLPNNGTALIVSHDGSMVAAEKILKGEPLVKAERNYQPLSGYKVNEDLTLEYFSL